MKKLGPVASAWRAILAVLFAVIALWLLALLVLLARAYRT